MGRTIALLLSALAFLSPPVLREFGAASSAPEFTESGELKLPQGYREWVYLTSGFDMSYNPSMQMGGQHMFDNVFVNPEAYKVFVNTGTWPDKTILVLEERGARDKGSINRSGNFQVDVMGLELHVKDEARFPASGHSSRLVVRRRQRQSHPPPTATVATPNMRQWTPHLSSSIRPLLPIAKEKRTLSASYLKDTAGQ